MKKIIIAAFTMCTLICASNTTHSQVNTIKTSQAPATPQNVLQWAREAKPHFDELLPRLVKIKPTKQKDIETKRVILQAIKYLKEINSTGKKLSIQSARKYDNWFHNAILTLQNNCPNGPDGSECCFSCNGPHPGGGSGWNISWCFARCFVFNFPGIG